mgnify:CR=1 FL=1
MIGAKQDELCEDFMVVRVYYFDVIKDLIYYGFTYKGEKYIYFTSSAGQIRTKKTVFIKESVWKQFEKTIMCGLTIDLINDERAKTTVAVNFESIKIEKIDDKTVEFTLPSPYNDFTDSLEFPLVPKHILGDIDPALVYEANFSKEPIGSGVFIYNAIQTSSLKNNAMQAVYLKRNDK